MPPASSAPPLILQNALRASSGPPAKPVEMHLANGRVCSITDGSPTPPPTDSISINCRNGLVLPSLCHPHVHLDKPYLMGTTHHPCMVRGDFAEALALTNVAKENYTHEDLMERGRRLVLESVEAGVTCMRAHVEVDLTVGMKCVEAGLALKREFGPEGRGVCDIQIAVFAQDPAFKGEDEQLQRKMRRQFFMAAERDGVDVIGTAPYVEETVEKAKNNIEWAVDVAMLHRKHLDFHLDYTLSPSSKPLIHHLLLALEQRRWASIMPAHLTITLGHCTRLSLYPPYALSQLRGEIAAARLPIHFVGLPTSDLHMMGREAAGGPARGGGGVPRGTLPLLQWAALGLDCALGINNVANAFTPFGGVDPLALVSAVGSIYQAATEEDCRTLLECVTTRAKRAIGILEGEDREKCSLDVSPGDKADLVVVGSYGRCKGVVDTAVDPGLERIVIKNGRVVARRQVERWIA